MKQTLTPDEAIEAGFPSVPEADLVTLMEEGGFVPVEAVNIWMTNSGFSHEQLMMRLLPLAASFARPPISNFKVGAVARGISGALYFGANIEFIGEALSGSVHGEQSAVNNAWSHGENGLESIAINAAPCGHCRQFLTELAESTDDLTILLKTNPQDLTSTEFTQQSLSSLIPQAFGPVDLNNSSRLLLPQDHGLSTGDKDELVRSAVLAANSSYAPYSNCFSGVALLTEDGRIVSGRYAENAAYNPSLSPLQSAVSQLIMSSPPQQELQLKAAVLAEKLSEPSVSQLKFTSAALHAVAPDIELKYVSL